MRFKGFFFSLFFLYIILLVVLFIGLPMLSTVSALSSTTGNHNDIKMVQFMPPNQMMDPIQQKFMQMRQNFAVLEQQLAMSNHQQQQLMIASVQQGIIQTLSQANPQQQFMFIQMLQQAMSPMLAQQILVPILSQGMQPMMPQSPQGMQPMMPQSPQGMQPMMPQSPQGMQPHDSEKTGLSSLLDECMASGNSRATCEAALVKPDFGICEGLALANVPCPVQ